MKFLVTGEIGLSGWRKFSKEIEAKTPGAAKEKVYSLFGASNRLKRGRVKISSIAKL